MGLGACSLLAASPPLYNPAVLNLEGWWRDFPNAWPWVGTASAGASANVGRRLADVGGNPTLAGLQNGYGIADYTPSQVNRADTETAMSVFQSTTAFSGWALINIDAIATNDANPFNNAGVVGTNGTGQLGVSLRDNAGTRTATVAASCSSVTRSATTSVALSAWTLLQWKGNTSTFWIRTNGGVWASGTGGTIDSLSGDMHIGHWVAYGNFKVLELAFSKSVLADATFDDVLTYSRARYGLAL